MRTICVIAMDVVPVLAQAVNRNHRLNVRKWNAEPPVARLVTPSMKMVVQPVLVHRRAQFNVHASCVGCSASLVSSVMKTDANIALATTHPKHVQHGTVNRHVANIARTTVVSLSHLIERSGSQLCLQAVQHAIATVQPSIAQLRRRIARMALKKTTMVVRHARVMTKHQRKSIDNVRQCYAISIVHMVWPRTPMDVNYVRVVDVHYKPVACSVCMVSDVMTTDVKSVNVTGRPSERTFNAVR